MGWKGLKKSSVKELSWPQLVRISPLSLKRWLAYDDKSPPHNLQCRETCIIYKTSSTNRRHSMNTACSSVRIRMEKKKKKKKTGCLGVSINTAAPQNGLLQGSCHSCTVLLWCLSCLQKKDVILHLISQRSHCEARCGADSVTVLQNMRGADSARQLLKEQLTQKFQASKQGCRAQLGTCFKKWKINRHYPGPSKPQDLKLIWKDIIYPSTCGRAHSPAWTSWIDDFFHHYFSPLNAVLLESFSLHSSCIQLL